MIVLAALVAPTAFWIGYLYYKDRYQPEPLRIVGVAYVLGIAAGWLCLHSYLVLEFLGLPEDPLLFIETHPLAFLAYCLGVIGPLEELFKLLPFALILIRMRSFDETLDGIIYASSLALGFATYENLFYLPVLDGFERWGRALASPLVHTMFASVWGYAVASAMLSGGRVVRDGLIGLAAAAGLHGIYDFFTLTPYLQPAAAGVVLVVWIWRIRAIQRLHRS